MIRLENITKIYKKGDVPTNALNGIDLVIKSGEFVAIMGTSGSGKSTLLNMIGCMDEITDGKYHFNEENISNLKGSKLSNFRRDHISFVFQNFALMNDYTIYENVELPLRSKRMGKKERKATVLNYLEELGIAQLAQKYPNTVSGGQQQRCAIARALASGNELLLADEPTGALDRKTSKEVMDLLVSLNKKGKTIIMVTHDVTVAQRAQRTIYIEDGKIVE